MELFTIKEKNSREEITGAWEEIAEYDKRLWKLVRPVMIGPLCILLANRDHVYELNFEVENHHDLVGIYV